ncbi:MAG: hypothetical protein IJV09_00110 [Prevotella sp.]|nr:hypothetical protein [Prevotella sp.]
METATLTLPMERMTTLPEEAEYSVSDNTTRVSVKRVGKDSLRISAQGIRPNKQKVLIAGDLSVRQLAEDTTASKVTSDAYLPRGQPVSRLTESLVICGIALLLIALIAYEYHQRKKQVRHG